MQDRRLFLKKSAAVSAGLAIAPNLILGNPHKKSADKLNVALIGVGLRGTNHLNNLLSREDVVVTAICDIDEKRINLSLDTISKANRPKPKTFGKDEYDYRNLLN